MLAYTIITFIIYYCDKYNNNNNNNNNTRISSAYPISLPQKYQNVDFLLFLLATKA